MKKNNFRVSEEARAGLFLKDERLRVIMLCPIEYALAPDDLAGIALKLSLEAMRAQFYRETDFGQLLDLYDDILSADQELSRRSIGVYHHGRIIEGTAI